MALVRTDGVPYAYQYPCKELNRTSFVWWIRDDVGRFVKAGMTWMMGSCSIVEGESIVLLEALKAMEQRGTSHVIF
ncbi:hypothetical protein L195_g026631 [Trifolium pratense]|uniref:Uncharacterized protein n=1 Tax=Trifolium pratense TaxID=57577 RepID=A0A2K3NJU5_TRIPR|nr:hypothetical protein L195_g026631 [Trifolium pratense]